MMHMLLNILGPNLYTRNYTRTVCHPNIHGSIVLIRGLEGQI